MSEPTSALSMVDLVTAIAKEAGTAYRGTNGTSASTIPINREDLQDIKDVINRGVRTFIADAPPSGWKWRERIMQLSISGLFIEGIVDEADDTSLTDATLETSYDSDDDLNGYWIYITSGTGIGSHAKITDYAATGGIITVAAWSGTAPAAADEYVITKYETVDGDVGRYYLPEDFGGEVGGLIEYAKNTDHATRISWVDEADVRRMRATSEVPTGYPYLAAIRPLEPNSGLGNKRRYELIVYPNPAQDDVLEFPYSVVFNKLDIESGVLTSVVYELTPG